MSASVAADRNAVVCLKCGRAGTRGFTVLSGDPYKDAGRVSWVCSNSGACSRREARHPIPVTSTPTTGKDKP